MIKYFDPNLVGIDYVVGDIHGCFTLLESKLEEIGFNKETDRLFSVGDLVDRGLESHRVLEFLNYPWFQAIRGNHEDMIIHIHDSIADFTNSVYNGGSWFTELEEDTQAEIIDRFLQLPLAVQVGDIGLVHAEVPGNDWDNITRLARPRVVYPIVVYPGLAYPGDEVYPGLLVPKHDLKQMIWGRTKITLKDTTIVKNISKVYVGHTVLKEAVILGNVHYIDTGAVFYNNLTVMKL